MLNLPAPMVKYIFFTLISETKIFYQLVSWAVMSFLTHDELAKIFVPLSECFQHCLLIGEVIFLLSLIEHLIFGSRCYLN